MARARSLIVALLLIPLSILSNELYTINPAKVYRTANSVSIAACNAVLSIHLKKGTIHQIAIKVAGRRIKVPERLYADLHDPDLKSAIIWIGDGGLHFAFDIPCAGGSADGCRRTAYLFCPDGANEITERYFIVREGNSLRHEATP
jgi:hypothetical protein